MKNHILFRFAPIVFAFAASPAFSDCFADYKAKRDNPLRLHYGVVELSAPNCADQSLAKRTITERLATDGWTLLNILSVFDKDGLVTRKQSAGEFYLRY